MLIKITGRRRGDFLMGKHVRRRPRECVQQTRAPPVIRLMYLSGWRLPLHYTCRTRPRARTCAPTCRNTRGLSTYATRTFYQKKKIPLGRLALSCSNYYSVASLSVKQPIELALSPTRGRCWLTVDVNVYILSCWQRFMRVELTAITRWRVSFVFPIP